MFVFDVDLYDTEAVAWRCSVKNVFLEISQNSKETTCVKVSFLIKVHVWGLQLYQKRDFGTSVFVWILQISKNIFFHITPLVAACDDKIVYF